MNTTDNNTKTKRIAIIANTNHKTHLIEWAFVNKDILSKHEIFANGKTALVLEGTLNTPVTELASRTLGGYRDLTKLIERGLMDVLIILNYDKISEKRQKQISELLHTAMEQNIVVAVNRTTADIVMTTLAADLNQSGDSQNQLTRVV
ncbi:MAG: methylglyoxal synthase [Chitinophagaceae bacterium]